MLKRIKKIAKITLIALAILLGVLALIFYRFSKPKSDEKVKEYFDKADVPIEITHQSYKGLTYRLVKLQKENDSLLPTLVFIHGSIGSVLDFKRYLSDNEINTKANILAYDRIGYGIHHTGNVQESIAFERDMLHHVLNGLNTSKVILVGYSYGGPIALASEKKYRKIILLAPAAYSKVEPMPSGLNLYRWEATRWMLPEVWKAASKEKLSHRDDLNNFENNWDNNPSEIISVHGDSDWIVPIENSFYIRDIFSPQQFEFVTLKDAGHGLVWSHFEEIKQLLLQQLN